MKRIDLGIEIGQAELDAMRAVSPDLASVVREALGIYLILFECLKKGETKLCCVIDFENKDVFRLDADIHIVEARGALS